MEPAQSGGNGQMGVSAAMVNIIDFCAFSAILSTILVILADFTKILQFYSDGEKQTRLGRRTSCVRPFIFD
ncbi:MAG: hypothetical protein HRU27_00580 [Rhizobiaceae bacterium]|nr:hypothetical protein [Hyphomicrobiales bacterium]NRB29068.1 hypothetical protein [Rhizobiaceae bacterium]